MKKGISLLLIAAMALLVLAGCGAKGTKRAQAEEQFAALDALFQRAGTAVADIDAVVNASGTVSASFGEYYTALSAERDRLSTVVDGASGMEEEELDALLEELTAKVNETQPVVASLEALLPEMEKMSSGITALVDDLTKVIALVQSGTASPELQRAYSEVSAEYQSVEGQLNGILSQADSSDLAAVLAAMQQANTALDEVRTRASTLLADLQAELG